MVEDDEVVEEINEQNGMFCELEDGHFKCPEYPWVVIEDPEFSSHGMVLNEVGGHAELDVEENSDLSPEALTELQAAAIDSANVVIQYNGETYYAPIEQVDPDKVELACTLDGCVLIPDDGNPHNDIVLPGM